MICAVLGTCLSCAQKEAKEAPAPTLVSALEHVALKSAVDDDDEIHTTIRTVPWTPTEVERIKEKYSRLPSESAVEYVWRVSAEGGDRIMLSEDEAGDTWGPGVFLTTMPGDPCYSLTARAAYWAGGMDPRERGEPLEIRAKGYSDLSAAVREAACLQAMYDREEFRKSPMLAPIDPD